MVQGCCRGVEWLGLRWEQAGMTQERSNLLAGALEVEGALAALTYLRIDFPLRPSKPAKLTGALKGGAAPHLEHLSILLNEEEDMEFVVAMLEARTKVPCCTSLKRFEGGKDSTWFDNASVAMQIRFWQILLWSMEELWELQWNPAFE
jgi:hypothetical protein